MKNVKIRKKMGHNNYKVLNKHFNPKVLIKKHRELYDDLLFKN